MHLLCRPSPSPPPPLLFPGPEFRDSLSARRPEAAQQSIWAVHDRDYFKASEKHQLPWAAAPVSRMLGTSSSSGAAVVRILPGHNSEEGGEPSEPRIWAVRHGKACRDAKDAANRPLPGRQQALLEEGVEQARSTGARWYGTCTPDAGVGRWRRVGVFVVSPLRRTIQTARHLIEGMESQHRRENPNESDRFRYPKVLLDPGIRENSVLGWGHDGNFGIPPSNWASEMPEEAAWIKTYPGGVDWLHEDGEDVWEREASPPWGLIPILADSHSGEQWRRFRRGRSTRFLEWWNTHRAAGHEVGDVVMVTHCNFMTRGLRLRGEDGEIRHCEPMPIRFVSRL
jgi:broad specificity phosphatase PhoE